MRGIAVLITSHNRRVQTLGALGKVCQQQGLRSVAQPSIYLVDDGSTDGTSEAIAEQFPRVKLLQGSGQLYWNGGMRLAFAEALKEGFEYYLWLNDDTTLYPDAVSRMIQASGKLHDGAIIVGSTRDAYSGQLTYGGVRRLDRWRPLRFTAILPEDTEIPVDTMNGNCVLIPQGIADRVGNLDPAFTHSMGDFDYGLRASHMNFAVIIARGFAGECSRHNLWERWPDPSLSFPTRLQRTMQPSGLPPREFAIFARRHGGPLWLLHWLLAYRRLVLL